ncbi:MAG: hypothetical protein ACW97W_08925 [Candidatus Hodarchaeales archaeon]
MPYREILVDLFNNQKILGILILDQSGNIWHHVGVFPQAQDRYVDGYYLIYEWVTYPASIEVAGVQYLSLLNSYPDYWLLSAIKGEGSLILQKSKKDYYFLAYLDEATDAAEIQKEIKIMSDLFDQGVGDF